MEGRTRASTNRTTQNLTETVFMNRDYITPLRPHPYSVTTLCYNSKPRVAATVSISLSPRPLSPTTIVWSLDSVGASLDTW